MNFLAWVGWGELNPFFWGIFRICFNFAKGFPIIYSLSDYHQRQQCSVDPAPHKGIHDTDPTGTRIPARQLDPTQGK